MNGIGNPGGGPEFYKEELHFEMLTALQKTLFRIKNPHDTWSEDADATPPPGFDTLMLVALLLIFYFLSSL